MLTIADVSKSYGTRTLFEDVSLFISRADRYGLVGANGTGKSTLFKLILGEEKPDDGTIEWERGANFGFLPQETAPAGDETVLDLATSISPEFSALQRAIHAWDHDHPEIIDSHDDLHTRFADLGGYQVEAKAISPGDVVSVREQLLHIIEPISGAVSTVSYDPIVDGKGRVQGYKVLAKRD